MTSNQTTPNQQNQKLDETPQDAPTAATFVDNEVLKSQPVDIIVIGSGFGSAVTALRLAQKGHRVVMLERGKRWPVTDSQDTFSTMDKPDGRCAWLSDTTPVGDPVQVDRYIGVLERINGDGVSVLAGAGVGGGSLVYNGVTLLPHREIFQKVFGDRVDYFEMANVYYPRAQSVLGASTIPKHLLDNPAYAAAAEWLKLGHHAGLDAKLVPETLDWNVVAQELQGKRRPSVTAGEFWYGNNSGAKLSLDKNYLRFAEDSGLLKIVAKHEVTSINAGPDSRYVVLANEIDEHGKVLAERRFVAKRVFLGAGSIGTSRLLVKAKARGWLPQLNEHVGQHWGTNGDFFSEITGLQSYVDPIQCGTAPVAIEHLDNPVSPITLVCFADYFSRGNAGQVTSIGMSTGPAKGSFQYDASTDSVRLHWPAQDPEVDKIIRAATITYERLANAYRGPGKLKFRPVNRGIAHGRHRGRPGAHGDAQTHPVNAETCSHPVGGVVLDLATDNIGAVKNYKGLYVVDGALIPGHTACANPSFTIAALAERNIERILARDF
ncbi:MAG TPA: GMC oxidoreductase [Burkholderiaceae bacterium]|nr:GMC oxidoreductase [Burkholderiaceae bacterium]